MLYNIKRFADYRQNIYFILELNILHYTLYDNFLNAISYFLTFYRVLFVEIEKKIFLLLSMLSIKNHITIDCFKGFKSYSCPMGVITLKDLKASFHCSKNNSNVYVKTKMIEKVCMS